MTATLYRYIGLCTHRGGLSEESLTESYTDRTVTIADFAPVDPRGAVLGDEVYARIGEAILDGTLQPGEHLRDHELAARLGVSRTPVREALQRLERAGLVEVAPNRYTRVSIPNPKVLADTHEFLVHLMGNVTRLALPRCTDDELAEVVVLMDAVIDASRADDMSGMLRSSSAVFERLTYIADNAAILRVMREGELAIRRSLAAWRPAISCPIDRSAAFERFRDALAARDGDEAERLLRALHTPA